MLPKLGVGKWSTLKSLSGWLEFVRIGICQNWNLSESEFVRIGICQNWNLSELEFGRIGICQNWKLSYLGPKMQSKVDVMLQSKLDVKKIGKCQNC